MEILFFIVLLVIFLFVISKKRSGSNGEFAITKIYKPEYWRINKTKHACKCYMEDLTVGEKKVADLLAMEMGFKDYFLFNNIIINSKNNISTQIDHIIVSKFGIFVIESKDYSGWIFGNKDQHSWTQSMPGAIKFKFRNPILQNYGHLMALKEMMPFAKDNFFNIVVFTGDAEIKTHPIENVVYLNDLLECIKKHNLEILNENQVQYAIGKLSYACQTVDITVEEHISNIYANKNIKNLNQNNRQSYGSYYNNKYPNHIFDKNPARVEYLSR